MQQHEQQQNGTSGIPQQQNAQQPTLISQLGLDSTSNLNLYQQLLTQQQLQQNSNVTQQQSVSGTNGVLPQHFNSLHLVSFIKNIFVKLSIYPKYLFFRLFYFC